MRVLTHQHAITRYGPVADDHLRQPRNLGSLPDADGVGRVEERATDTLLIVAVALTGRPGDQRVVRHARFRAFGCGGSIIAGSITTVLVTGLSVERARLIDAETVIRALEDGLPPEQRYCAGLAAEALHRALDAAGA